MELRTLECIGLYVCPPLDRQVSPKENIHKKQSDTWAAFYRRGEIIGLMLKDEILLTATKAYEGLLNREYIVTVGKNKKLESYSLSFTKNEYKHIFGLQKLDDVPFLKHYASAKVFEEVREDADIRKKIVSSDFFYKISKRIENLADLEQHLDSFTELHKWDNKLAFNKVKSKIKADILIASVSLKNSNDKVFIFFKKRNDDTYSVTNFFTDDIALERTVTFVVDKKDYTRGQPRPATVLYKEKCDKRLQSKTILLDRLNK